MEAIQAAAAGDHPAETFRFFIGNGSNLQRADRNTRAGGLELPLAFRVFVDERTSQQLFQLFIDAFRHGKPRHTITD